MGEERINKLENEGLPKLEEDDAAKAEQSLKRGELPADARESQQKRGDLSRIAEENEKRGVLPGKESQAKRGDLSPREQALKSGELTHTEAEDSGKRSAPLGEEKDKRG